MIVYTNSENDYYAKAHRYDIAVYQYFVCPVCGQDTSGQQHNRCGLCELCMHDECMVRVNSYRYCLDCWMGSL